MVERYRNERGGIAVQMLGIVALLAGIVFVAPWATRELVHQLAEHAVMSSSAKHTVGDRIGVPAQPSTHRPRLAISVARFQTLAGNPHRARVRVVARNLGTTAYDWRPRIAYVLDDHGVRHPLLLGLRTHAGRPLRQKNHLGPHRALTGLAYADLTAGRRPIEVDLVFSGHGGRLRWAVLAAG